MSNPPVEEPSDVDRICKVERKRFPQDFMFQLTKAGAGWKKFEPAWDFVIRLKQLAQLRPVLEAVLSPVNKSVRDQNERSTREDIESTPITVEASTFRSMKR